MSEEESHREFLLAALRAASLRLKTLDADCVSIGVALKGDLIGAETAVAWIRDSGLMWAVGAMPHQIGELSNG